MKEMINKKLDNFIIFYPLILPPNGSALSCGAEYFQVAEYETSSC
jgi:hypothetical protein